VRFPGFHRPEGYNTAWHVHAMYSAARSPDAPAQTFWPSVVGYLACCHASQLLRSSIQAPSLTSTHVPPIRWARRLCCSTGAHQGANIILGRRRGNPPPARPRRGEATQEREGRGDTVPALSYLRGLSPLKSRAPPRPYPCVSPARTTSPRSGDDRGPAAAL